MSAFDDLDTDIWAVENRVEILENQVNQLIEEREIFIKNFNLLYEHLKELEKTVSFLNSKINWENMENWTI